MRFNDSQEKAIDHFNGPCLVLAGPGSGKTAVITARIKRLIEKGVSPEKVLVITFTKAAALEMKERFKRLMESGDSVSFGTFHSLFWGILQREFGYKTSNILMGNERDRILKEALRQIEIERVDEDIIRDYSSFLTNVMAHPSPEKLDMSAFAIERPWDFILTFNRLKEKYKLIDFDDMLVKAYKLFIERPDILEKWQRRFTYILVDEMQDMNGISFELIKMLAGNNRNLFMVGDDDQSIYGFRGSNPRIMQEFAQEYPDYEKIILDINYRNPAELVGAASNLINKNENRFAKDIKATNQEGSIALLPTEDPIKEADRVCTLIEKDMATGIDLDHIAVLYRNHSDARFLVDLMMKKNIPLFIKEQSPNVYSHFIIMDMEAYFRIAINDGSLERMLRVVNRPNRYVSREALKKDYSFAGLRRYYETSKGIVNRLDEMEQDLLLIKKMSPFAAANYIYKMMGYERYLREESISQGKDFAELVDIFYFFLEVIRDEKSIKSALEKLSMLRLKTDYENKNKKGDKRGKVGLYTLHSSKGLEFEKLYIIGANEGIIPSKKAKSKEEIEGERRLFYVGVTRAKKDITISWVENKNRERNYPSRFINELGIK
ncbi:MAG: ATP-dependent helicase [Pseudobutyrivibrio sp.]|nr:ATP-dependent helicase [Pseudobutyrivibrio sp.]